MEVKAQLDAGEAEQVMCQCDYYKNICVAMLLGDDERQKKTIATLKQQLSQYKQVQAQDVKRNSGLVLELQKCSERNMEFSKTNERFHNDLFIKR